MYTYSITAGLKTLQSQNLHQQSIVLKHSTILFTSAVTIVHAKHIIVSMPLNIHHAYSYERWSNIDGILNTTEILWQSKGNIAQ